MTTGEVPSGAPGHVPVLLHEVLHGLQIEPGALCIDGTVGGGGHTAEMLRLSAPDGCILGMDADADAIERVSVRFRVDVESGRLTLVNGNFTHMEQVARLRGFTDVDAVLLDLGVSSYQLDQKERGFSFQQDGPLDMRMDMSQPLSAFVVVNEWPESELADAIYRYGDERKSRRIARAIVAKRPITTTAELAEVVSQAVGGRRGMRIHPATRTFQGIRIAVNEELTMLGNVLPQCLRLLKAGGRLAVISFHSLEDRIVKQWMKHEAADYVPDPSHPKGGVSKQATVKIVTKRPIGPSEEEESANPRSRSAKLRIVEKLELAPEGQGRAE